MRDYCVREPSVYRGNRPELSTIAEQLIDLGIADSTWMFFGKEEAELSAMGLDSAGRLIDYVMAAGRLNCPIPVNLTFRALGQTDSANIEHILHLFADIDLFRWRMSEDGSDYLISPRIQLEAELICRRRLGPEQEIDRLIDIIRCVRLGVDHNAERSFLLDLLTKIVRNGPRGAAYRPGYLRVADSLRELREHGRIFEPTLVLRECVLRRQAVFSAQHNDVEDRTDEERFSILDDARDTLERTLTYIDNENIRIHRRTKQGLISERSAIYGYLAVERAQSSAGEEFWSDYLAARAASEKAMGLGRDFHPIDIALWTARDVLQLRKTDLSDVQRAEILADLHSTIDVADDVFGIRMPRTGLDAAHGSVKQSNISQDNSPDESLVTIDQRARYLERRARVAYAMADSTLTDETLFELENVAPSAATFLIAKRKSEQVDTKEPPFDDGIRRLAADAADYISRRDASGVETDDRCQRLLLRLRWAQSTGERLMLYQRGRTPSRLEHVHELLSIVSFLNDQSGMDARNRERYLEAVLCWLAKDTTRAIEVWRSLSRDTEYEDRSRVVRWLIDTDEAGAPRRFRGRVEQRGEHDWHIRVEGIDKPIVALPRDFSSDDLSRGRELRDFGVAFNYIGPIADPLSR